MELFDSFRARFPFELDDFQVEAIRAIEAGQSVIVSAPTGAGKTLVAEFAIHLALAQGRRIAYTTPLKALSNQKFADFVRWRGKKVLEIGCGIGTDSINFARAGADVTVVDLSDESLQLCETRFDVYGLKAHFYLGDAEELSKVVPVENYALIYSFGVIHHTPRPERVM